MSTVPSGNSSRNQSVRNLLAAGSIVLLTLLVYANTFQVPFLYDDIGAIVRFPLIRDLRLLPDLFVAKPARFVPYATLALNYALHGLQPPGYHAVNMAVHMLAGLAVWGLSLLIMNTTPVRKRLSPDAAWWCSLAAALVFVVHPVQTQAVTYIVQRMASIAALLYISAVWLYGRSRLQTTRNKRRARRDYLLAFCVAVLAVHSKQNTFTLPLMLLLFEWCFVPPSRRAWRPLLPFAAIALLIPAEMLFLGSATGLGDAAAEAGAPARFSYLLTQFSVLPRYLKLMVLPVGQTLDPHIPLVKSVAHPGAMAGVALVLAAVYAAIRLFGRHRLVTFAVGWFFIAMAVESSIIPIKDVMYEHRLYLPMAGVTIGISYLLWQAAKTAARMRRRTRPEQEDHAGETQTSAGLKETSTETIAGERDNDGKLAGQKLHAAPPVQPRTNRQTNLLP